MKTKVLLQNVLLLFFLVTFFGFFPEIAKAFQDHVNYDSAEVSKKTMAFYKLKVDEKIRVDLNNETVEQSLKEIAGATGLRLTYHGNILTDKKVTLKNESISVSDALASVLKGTSLEPMYSSNGYLLITNEGQNNNAVSIQQIAQETIRGTITDATTGESLPGVNIIVEGTDTGTTTDLDGNFELEVSSLNETLIFSYIGYQTQELSIEGRTEIDVTLVGMIGELDELVVVGYGTMERATITGSVTSVRGEDVVRAPVTNLSNSLTGRLPGVTTYQRSGEPGSDGSTIRIRGVNTLGNNSALIVVDGIPGRSLERIDPNSVESITVLKDASAAIYGSQAANGVILITTKRGTVGEPEITINFNQGVNQPTRIPKMADAAEYATMVNELNMYAGGTPSYTDEEIQKYRDGSDPWRYSNTDWFAEVLKPWSTQNYMNASVAGGSDNLSYYLSLGSKFQDGYYYNSGTNYKQQNFHSNIDGRISENINIAFDISGRIEDRNYPTRGAGEIFRSLQRSHPNTPGYWPDGNPGPDVEYGDNPVVVSTDATGYDIDKRYVFNSKINMEINVPWIEGLSMNGTASVDKHFRNRKVFTTPWYLYSWDGQSYDENNEPITESGIRGFNDARLEQSMEDNQSILVNGILNFERDIEDQHNIKILAGIETLTGEGSNFEAFRRYFNSEAIDQLFAGGDAEKDNFGSGYETARLNYFSRINYAYLDRYLFEFVGRYDGSYIFPEEGRFGFFPGVSVGWILSEENFWRENFSFLEFFKLRGSWGKTGNDRIAPWQYLSSYGFGSGHYIFGQTVQNQILNESRIPNDKVTWEIANQANIGFETYFLDGKLGVEFDYFDYKRTDILAFRNASVPASTGLSLPRENIGEVANKGFEFNIGYQGQMQNLSYELSLNGGYAKNKILFWDEPPGAPEYQQSTGRPIGSDLYYKAIGIFRSQAEIDSYPHWSGAVPGDVIFEDVNDDGVINSDDRIRDDRNNVPRFTGGMNWNLNYKNFDISILMQGAAGAIRYISTNSGYYGNFLKDFYDNRWTPDNPDAKGPRTYDRDFYWVLNDNTHYTYSTDYIRLKNLEFGYNLPPNVANALGINNLRIYVSGYNLFTFSPDLKDFDPESDNDAGHSYPVQRVINGGITLRL